MSLEMSKSNILTGKINGKAFIRLAITKNGRFYELDEIEIGGLNPLAVPKGASREDVEELANAIIREAYHDHDPQTGEKL